MAEASPMPELARRNFSAAVSVVSASLEAERDADGHVRADLMDELMMEHLETDDGVVGLTFGLLTLTGDLLVRLEKATGRSVHQLLQDAALRYA